MSSLKQASIIRLLAASYRMLSSLEALIWIAGLWIIYYTTAMIWDREAFAHFISGLQSNIIIQLPFVIFLVSGYLNLVRVIVSSFKGNRWKTFRISLLPMGIMLLFTGVFISITARQFEWILAMPGQTIKPHWSLDSYTIIEVDPGIEERILDIDIEKGGGLFKYEPKISVRDSRSASFQVGAFPPSRIGDSFFHVLNFGLAPLISISENGVVTAQEYVPLRLLQPGSSDTFEIQPLPYKFLMSLEPDKIHQKGELKAAEYNMRDPLYQIRVLDGQKVISEKVTKEKIDFNDMSLGFQRPVFWVQLEIVKDRGVYMIIFGLFLVFAGIPLYIAELVLRNFHK